MKLAEYKKVQAHISLEYEDACLLADYLEQLRTRGKIAVYSHIAHENNISYTARMKNKRMGWHKGVPDYIIVTQNSVIFLELKRFKNGTVLEDQKIWLDAVEGKTTKAILAKGFWDAKKQIDDLIGGDN